MKEFLNENTLYNTLAMYLAEGNSLLLVVEGPDDHLMLKEHCSSDLVLIAGIGGKGQVLRAAELCIKRDLRGVRFLVDRDYDDFTGLKRINLNNVFMSEGHDCFIDVLTSDPALLNRVIDVESSSARRRPGITSALPNPSEIQAEAVALASHLVAVRVMDARRGLGLDFKKFSFGGLKVSEFDIKVIAEKVLVRSSYGGADSVEIIDEVVRTHLEMRELPHLPVGDHDLFSALSRILKQFNVSVSSNALHRGVILAVSCSALKGTIWFKQIQEWCARNDRVGFTCVSSTAFAA
ncbi:hypothetical protein E7Z53_16650 [Kocuria salina]|uniref:hypothetical protein n=1 Tax=Kocuria salina TaxID=1929416 RepID=UPI0015942073|nr:hypothetical protein [Kocuria salina]NVC25055.1 hypothetical protein [Kocuria salina]